MSRFIIYPPPGASVLPPPGAGEVKAAAVERRPCSHNTVAVARWLAAEAEAEGREMGLVEVARAAGGGWRLAAHGSGQATAGAAGKQNDSHGREPRTRRSRCPVLSYGPSLPASQPATRPGGPASRPKAVPYGPRCAYPAGPTPGAQRPGLRGSTQQLPGSCVHRDREGPRAPSCLCATKFTPKSTPSD